MLVSDASEEEAHARRIPTVLILVLVDVGLGLQCKNWHNRRKWQVLILVLVDVGLGLQSPVRLIPVCIRS